MTPSIRRSPTPVRTIVIVDRDVGFVAIVRERIRQAGYRPIWAPDAREALAAITHEKPAMLVIDIDVPCICGLELLAKLDRSPALARIPRVVLSVGPAAGSSCRRRARERWNSFTSALGVALARPIDGDTAVRRQPAAIHRCLTDSRG
jgi:CheY-like chemotaxis protein